MTSAQPAAASLSLRSQCPDHLSTPVVADVQVALDDLPQNHCAFVRRVDGSSEDSDRLKVMGICIGRRVQLIKKGDPMIVRVLGSRLGISARLGHRVIVSTCEAPECQTTPPETPEAPEAASPQVAPQA